MIPFVPEANRLDENNPKARELRRRRRMWRVLLAAAVVAALVLIVLGRKYTALPATQTTFPHASGGEDFDWGDSVAQTADGGRVTVGYAASSGGDDDVRLTRTDTSGDTMWTRTYGGPNSDRGNSVLQTTDGGYVIAGETRSFGAGDWDVYLVKTDASGDTMWTRTYGDAGDDFGYSVALTADGGYIIAGYSGYCSADNRDVWLVKTDSAGKVATAEP